MDIAPAPPPRPRPLVMARSAAPPMQHRPVPPPTHDAPRKAQIPAHGAAAPREEEPAHPSPLAHPSQSRLSPERRDRSPPPPASRAARPVAAVPLAERFDALPHAAPYIAAVGRVPGRGSCFVFSSVTGRRAVLLTTSDVFAARREAMGATAVFLEDPVLGHALPRPPPPPLEVRLRPDRLFVCSRSGGPSDRSLGYTVVACDVTPAPPSAPAPPPRRRSTEPSSAYSTARSSVVGSSAAAADHDPMAATVGRGSAADDAAPPPRTDLRVVRPLPLPLLPHHDVPVRVGDVHLVVAHPNAARRRHYACVVAAVEPAFCVYGELDVSSDFATGGPVFARDGALVGLHHQRGDCNMALRMPVVARHMYESCLLGRCGIPLRAAGPRELQTNFGWRRYGDDAEELRRRTAHPMLGPDDPDTARGGFAAGAGPRPTATHVLPLAEWELQREQRRRPEGPLAVPSHADVWAAFYDAANYQSLVLMLHAFHTHPPLLRMLVDALCSAEHRRSLPSLARRGGVGILLEALDAAPYDEALLTAGLTLLGHASLHEENAEALAKYAGVQTVLALLPTYRNSGLATPWGLYTLGNLCGRDGGSQGNAEANAAVVVENNGVELAVGLIRTYPRSTYAVRWGCMLLANVLTAPRHGGHGDATEYHDIALRGGVCGLAVECLAAHTENPTALHGVAALLHALAFGDVCAPTAAALVTSGALPHVAAAVAQRDVDAGAAWHLATAAAHLMAAPASLAVAAAAAAECGLAGALADCAQRSPADDALQTAVAAALEAVAAAAEQAEGQGSETAGGADQGALDLG